MTNKPALLHKKARDLGIPDEVLAQIPVRYHESAGGVVHAVRGWCPAVRAQRNGNGKQDSLPEIAAREICPSCAPRLYHVREPELNVLLQIVDATDLARSVERTRKKGGQGPIGKAQKLDDRIRERLALLSHLAEGDLGGLSDAHEKVREELEKKQRELGEFAQSDTVRKRLETQMRRELLAGQSHTLEDEQVLVGFSGYIPSRLAEAVLSTYALRSEGRIRVLLCPRYVYDHLGRTLPLQNGNSGWFLGAVRFPGTREQAEIAAKLWQPGQGGNDLAAVARAGLELL